MICLFISDENPFPEEEDGHSDSIKSRDSNNANSFTFHHATMTSLLCFFVLYFCRYWTIHQFKHNYERSVHTNNWLCICCNHSIRWSRHIHVRQHDGVSETMWELSADVKIIDQSIQSISKIYILWNKLAQMQSWNNFTIGVLCLLIFEASNSDDDVDNMWLKYFEQSCVTLCSERVRLWVMPSTMMSRNKNRTSFCYFKKEITFERNINTQMMNCEIMCI